jgi:deoxyribose-phosphate aldolase
MTTPVENLRPPLASYEDLARMVDYAVLQPQGSEEQVAKACGIARRCRVGRFTVRPADLDLVKQWMQGSAIPIATTAGYPHASETTAAKLYATGDALRRGANAIETVLNPGKIVSRQFRYVESELMQMAQECHRAGAELILDLELGWLPQDLRVIACRIAKRAEVDWVRAGSLFGPGLYGAADLQFLALKLGDSVKLDAGPSVNTLDEALAAHASGATAFQIADPTALLDAWKVELKRRETAATPPPASRP